MENWMQFILVLFISVCLTFFWAWIMMFLWNILMPVVFGLQVLTYWQVLGLKVLIDLLIRPPISATDMKRK